MGDINYYDTITLGKINSWGSKKIAKIDPVTFPGQDAGYVEGIDTLGIFEVIDFEGRWTGSFKSIQGFISAIKNSADGNQDIGKVLKSPFVNQTDNSDTIRAGALGTNTSAVTNKLVDTNGNFVGIGIQVGDIVKNFATEAIANVTVIDSATQLTLDADIFPSSGVSYAVTANILCKILSFETTWELPGMNYCKYKLSVVQVAF